jgi:mannose-6-phosphate isomerase-like protein (cupin superfamily)
MNMRIVLGSLLMLAAASVLITSVGDIAYGNHFPQGGGDDEGPFFSEVPVDGVRIIREEDYPKRPAHYLSSNLYTTLAHGRETGNRFCAFDFQVPDGGGPLPHTHRNEWETFFVHPGQAPVAFTVGVASDPTTDPPSFNFIEEEIPDGTVVYGPQCPVHGFINKSGQFSRIFSFVMPCGLENFFLTSGEKVVDFFAPIPQITQEEIVRTAFWAEQRGDALHFLAPGIPAPPPTCPPDTPKDVISSITGENPITGEVRRRIVGLFGEERVSLLTRAEVGSITGATAFCGPGAPGRRQGGTVNYSYFSLPQQDDFPTAVTSQNIEVFYTLGGTLWFKFEDKTVQVPALTYVEIQPGVSFSMANLAPSGKGRKKGSKDIEPAESLAISVINDCPPPPPGAMALGQSR